MNDYSTITRDLFSGSEDCPCIDVSIDIVGTLNVPCKVKTVTQNNTTSTSLVDGGIASVGKDGRTLTCYPITYGSSYCDKHDLTVDPACAFETEDEDIINNNNNKTRPSYCEEKWCYVDMNKCKRSTKTAARGEYFPFVDLFYSYETCNSSIDPWRRYQSILPLNNKNNGLTVTVPLITNGRHYKLNQSTGDITSRDGDEYYNDSIPFQGPLIDYVDSIVEASAGSIKGVNYTFRSTSSDLTYPASTYTASVYDVHLGLSDLAVGTFWVTTERLLLTPFTTNFNIDKILLVVERPTINTSFGFQTKKLLEPLDPALWAVLIVSLVVTALLGAWIKNSTSQKQNTAWLKFWKSNNGKKGQTLRQRLFLSLRLVLDSFLEKGMFFFGASVEQDEESTLPYKLLMFGFSFLILISISAYVANLAAHLTLSGVSNFIDSMEKAKAAGVTICASSVLQNELQQEWPDTNFLFYTRTKPTGYPDLDHYDDNNCSVLAASFTDTKLTDYLGELCSRNLVFTKAVVLEIPMAFPINKDLAAGFSYWMEQSETNSDNLYQRIAKGYEQRLSCDPYDIGEDNTEADEYASITLTNMAFAIIFFMAFALVAVLLQLYVSFVKKSYTGHKFIGTSSKCYHEHTVSLRERKDDGNKCNDCIESHSTEATLCKEDKEGRELIQHALFDDKDFVDHKNETAIVHQKDISPKLDASSPSHRTFEQMIENVIRLEKEMRAVRTEMVNYNENQKEHLA